MLKDKIEELKKEKITLSLEQQTQWESHFDVQKQNILKNKQKLNELETKLDQMF